MTASKSNPRPQADALRAVLGLLLQARVRLTDQPVTPARSAVLAALDTTIQALRQALQAPAAQENA